MIGPAGYPRQSQCFRARDGQLEVGSRVSVVRG